jgi:hypothetical protein
VRDAPVHRSTPAAVCNRSAIRLSISDGEDVSEYVDWSMAERINLVPKRVNVDLPAWVVNGLDREPQRLGVTRQAARRPTPGAAIELGPIARTGARGPMISIYFHAPERIGRRPCQPPQASAGGTVPWPLSARPSTRTRVPSGTRW